MNSSRYCLATPKKKESHSHTIWLGWFIRSPFYDVTIVRNINQQIYNPRLKLFHRLLFMKRDLHIAGYWINKLIYIRFVIILLSGRLNHLFRRINFSILGHGIWFLKTCISVLLPEATLVHGFRIVFPVRNLIVNISIITLCIFFFQNSRWYQYYRVVILFLIATELALKSFVKF